MKLPKTATKSKKFKRAPMSKPRLTIELVPSTAWYSNLRKMLHKDVWDRLRRSVYEKAGHRCEICGGVGLRHPVECHEVWSWTHRKATNSMRGGQRLERVMALCPDCHTVKHFGFAQVRGLEKKAMRHLTKVNGWNLQEGQKYVAEMFREWDELSSFEWVLIRETLRPVLIEHLPDFDEIHIVEGHHG